MKSAVVPCLLLCLSLALVPGPVRAGQVPFADRQPVVPVTDPIKIRLADLDGDGDLDLLAASFDGSEVTWAANLDGKGTFGTPVLITGSSDIGNATSAVAADLDADGDLDVITTGFAAGGVAWYENLDGHGDFGQPGANRLAIAAAVGPFSAVPADIDRDGRVDVLVASQSAGRVVWYRNDGVPAAGPWVETEITSVAGGARHAFPADLDGDGDPDVLVASVFGNVFEWYENVGAGDFVAGRPIDATRLSGRWIEGADIDGNGTIDALTASCVDNTLAWYANDGTPASADSSDWNPFVIDSAADCPETITAADMDQDGDLDVVSASSAGVVRWYENVSGTFLDPAIDLPASVPGAIDARVADVDGDGDPDIVSASNAVDEIDLYENRTIHRSAVFGLQNIIYGDTNAIATDAGDIDRDGDPDVVDGARTVPVQWWRNDGLPAPGFTTSTAIVDDPDDLTDVELGDMDNDGDLDLVSSTNGVSSPGLFVSSNGGSGLFLPPVSIGSGLFYDDLALADMDRDGRLDVVTAATNESGEPRLQWTTNSATYGYVNQNIVLDSSVAVVTAVAVADMNRDGRLDIVTGGIPTGPAAGLLTVYFNEGPGVCILDGVPCLTDNDCPTLEGTPQTCVDAFVQGENRAVDPYDVRELAVGELNRDANPDTAFVTQTSLYWMPNAGPEGCTDGVDNDGDMVVDEPDECLVLGEPVLIDGGLERPSVVRITDLDGDSDGDILVGTETVVTLKWFENLDGEGLFGPARNISSGDVDDTLAVDLDGDGDLDVLRASESDVLLSWFENQGGQFRFDTVDVTPPVTLEGVPTAVLAITVTLNGRPGDPAGELASVDLRFETSPGFPFSTSFLRDFLSDVRIYRDTDSGVFEASDDILVGIDTGLNVDVNGELTIPLADGDRNVRVAGPSTFFVVVTLAEDAVNAELDQLVVTHVVESSSIVEDATFDLPLIPEPAANVASGLVLPFQATTVDTTADVVAVDSVTSLREAVIAANANPGPDIIRLAPGTYTLAIAGANENAAATGDLDITDGSGELRIEGAGASQTIIDANGIDRVFELRGGSATFMGVTITRGNPPPVDGQAASRGGGIGHFCCTGGVATLIESVVTENVASFSGAVDNNSPLGGIVLRDTTIANNNNAIILGMGFLDADGVVFSGQSGTGVQVNAAATATLRNAVFTENGVFAFFNNGGTANLGNSVFSGNGQDIAGPITSLGFNFIGNIGDPSEPAATGLVDGVNGDQVGTNGAPLDALLGPLQDNGGPVPTHAPQPGSPLIDAGNCVAGLDVRGNARPIDLLTVANAAGGNGCDIGPLEVTLSESLQNIQIPVRWCALAGSPSIPGATPTATSNELLRQRLDIASEQVLLPRANIRVRSGATELIPDFPVIADPDLTVGNPGDIAIDPLARNYDELLQVFASCRTAWQALDPSVTGITAVNINRFRNPDGTPSDILGVAGRAAPLNPAQQVVAGQFAVVDPQVLATLNPPDAIEKTLNHEFLHAAGSLPHGNGIDDDSNGILDDEDDAKVGLPTFDGPNVMQYRPTGTETTLEQVVQSRLHALTTIPDITVEPLADAVADDVPLDQGLVDILDFGFVDILDFGLVDILDFGLVDILDFEEDETLDFGFVDILDFGMTYQDDPNAPVADDDATTLFTSTAGLPWPDPIQPAADYLWYLDADDNDATGAYPPDLGFPGEGFVLEQGVDIIAKVTSGPLGETSEFLVWNMTAGAYEVVSNPVSVPEGIEPVRVGLLQDTGGAEPARQEQFVGVNVVAHLANSILRGQGWSAGSNVGLEALTVLQCGGTLPAGFDIDCQCTDCADCPDFPGCVDTGTPATVDPEVLVQRVNTVLVFEQPVLPDCDPTADPVLSGQAFTVNATGFPTDLAGGMVEVFGNGAVIGTALIDASGSAAVAVTVPAGTAAGPLSLTAVGGGRGNAGYCQVTVAAVAAACQDGDGDGYGANGSIQCAAGPAVDCDDGDDRVNPGALEICGNGKDDDCDGAVDDDDSPDCDLLFVLLDSFTAEVEKRAVTVRWQTSVEVDNLGFRVLRGAAGAEPEIISGDLIPGRGDAVSGGDYTFVDRSRLKPGVYDYWLEDMDFSGQVTRHGPVQVKVGRALGVPARGSALREDRSGRRR